MRKQLLSRGHPDKQGDRHLFELDLVDCFAAPPHPPSHSAWSVRFGPMMNSKIAFLRLRDIIEVFTMRTASSTATLGSSRACSWCRDRRKRRTHGVQRTHGFARLHVDMLLYHTASPCRHRWGETRPRIWKCTSPKVRAPGAVLHGCWNKEAPAVPHGGWKEGYAAWRSWWLILLSGECKSRKATATGLQL